MFCGLRPYPLLSHWDSFFLLLFIRWGCSALPLLAFRGSFPHHLAVQMLISHNRGLPTTTRSVTYQNKMVSVGAFPIGIQPERFTRTLEDAKVQERIAELEHEFRGRQVMVGVDRLDYVKGVPQKLRAFETFLTDHPEYVGRAILIQIAIPTRGEVEEYQNLRLLVNELVGRINGKFGRFLAHGLNFTKKSILMLLSF